ncbi:hypothetical protein B0H16DRAFT_1572356 [Mycena metata]|uniref:Uncharacterized protein n=1 Tax=Mycena metata TaxID=1033252 RepID=A0AAD7I8F5_9AGAR|nr:hypothetical protein B0H16DRAFT_1572356 [Mycena metata]
MIHVLQFSPPRTMQFCAISLEASQNRSYRLLRDEPVEGRPGLCCPLIVTESVHTGRCRSKFNRMPAASAYPLRPATSSSLRTSCRHRLPRNQFGGFWGCEAWSGCKARPHGSIVGHVRDCHPPRARRFFSQARRQCVTHPRTSVCVPSPLACFFLRRWVGYCATCYVLPGMTNLRRLPLPDVVHNG